MSSRLAMYGRVSGGRYLWALRSCTISRMPKQFAGMPTLVGGKGNRHVMECSRGSRSRPLLPARVVPEEREFVGGVADARIEGFLPHLEGLLSCQKPLQSKPPLHPPLWFRLPTTKPSSATRFASSRTKASGRTSRRWTRRVSSSPSSLNNSFSWV